MLSDGSAHRPRWAHPQIRHKHTDCTPKCPQTEAALIFVPGFIESELAAATPVTLAFLPFLFSFWTCKRTQRGHQGRRKRRCRGAAGAPSSHCWAGLPGSAPRPSWSFLPLVRVCTATEQRPELHTSRPSYAVKGLLGRPRAGPQGSPWGPYALGPVTWVVRGHSGPGRGEGGEGRLSAQRGSAGSSLSVGSGVQGAKNRKTGRGKPVLDSVPCPPSRESGWSGAARRTQRYGILQLACRLRITRTKRPFLSMPRSALTPPRFTHLLKTVPRKTSSFDSLVPGGNPGICAEIFCSSLFNGHFLEDLSLLLSALPAPGPSGLHITKRRPSQPHLGVVAVHAASAQRPQSPFKGSHLHKGALPGRPWEVGRTAWPDTATGWALAPTLTVGLPGGTQLICYQTREEALQMAPHGPAGDRRPSVSL